MRDFIIFGTRANPGGYETTVDLVRAADEYSALGAWQETHREFCFEAVIEGKRDAILLPKSCRDGE